MCVKAQRAIPAQPNTSGAEANTVAPRRADNRDERDMTSPRSGDHTAARGDAVPATSNQQLSGVVGDASVTAGQHRSGDDVRKRGWFWHWNSIVTQFSPLIGLKGVGLLNSYTVWTDRREESPHRGFAFPSQQREADFYGEDRNELITINKILVALDLIEIRKEMVPRTDASGRKWKVPHNLYRVKDHGDEFNLTVDDVRRVVELANRDSAVYRYVRRIFSPRFAPIDKDNVWHQILIEMEPDATWQKLVAKTIRLEKKTSARSKAGHEARKTTAGMGDSFVPESGDSKTSESTAPATGNDSPTGNTNDSDVRSETSAASYNNGSEVIAAHTNNGLDEIGASVDALVSNDRPTNVAPNSTTYNQELTTTTTGQAQKSADEIVNIQQASFMGDALGGGPDDRRDEEATVRLFDEANSRDSSAAARRQLRKHATECADLAQSAGMTGWRLVGAAIEEAVSSGSAFVAPKRVREIMNRWERDGVPAEYATTPLDSDGSSRVSEGAVTEGSGSSHRFVRTSKLPSSGEDLWEQTCEQCHGLIDTGDLARMRHGVSVVEWERGTVKLLTEDADLTRRMHGEALAVLQRKLGLILRRPVRVVVSGPSEPPPDPSPTSSTRSASTSASRDALRPQPFVMAGIGMSSTQVWQFVVEDARGSGAIPASEIDMWMTQAAILQQDHGGVVVGLPNTFGLRRANRYISAITSALRAVTGREVPVSLVQMAEWLADQRTGTDG